MRLEMFDKNHAYPCLLSPYLNKHWFIKSLYCCIIWHNSMRCSSSHFWPLCLQSLHSQRQAHPSRWPRLTSIPLHTLPERCEMCSRFLKNFRMVIEWPSVWLAWGWKVALRLLEAGNGVGRWVIAKNKIRLFLKLLANPSETFYLWR